MLVAPSGYKDWHEAIFGKENHEKLLPISEEELKSYCISLFKSGYAPSTIMQVHVNGLCTWVRGRCVCLLSIKIQCMIRLRMLLMRTTKALILQNCVFSATSKNEFTSLMFPQHMSNSLPSPKKAFPGIASTLKKYFKAHHGERTSFARKPPFPQDVEHMIDVSGIDTPQQLQSNGLLDIRVIAKGSLNQQPPYGIG